MTIQPMIVVVAHRRSMDTVLGEQLASLVYDGYLGNLRRAGAAAVIASPGTPVPGAVLREMDGLLLTGGGDVDPARFGATAAGSDVDPERDALEADLVAHCRDRRIPVLGICRGAQMINVALGGTLANVEGHVQDQPLHDPVDRVDVVAGCRLSGLLGDTTPVGVNSFHRWAIHDPADGVRIVAHASDGVVEGIEWTGDDWFAVGAQWHAELLDEAHVAGLFEGFVAAARARRTP